MDACSVQNILDRYCNIFPILNYLEGVITLFWNTQTQYKAYRCYSRHCNMAVLTQALGNFSAPGAIAHTSEDGREGKFITWRTAVAHAGAPLKVTAFQQPIGNR